MTHEKGCDCVGCTMLAGEDVVCDAPGCVANRGHSGPHVGALGVARQAVREAREWIVAKLRRVA